MNAKTKLMSAAAIQESGPAAQTPEKPERRTMTIPEAGEALGIGRNAAYEAAHRGEIPTIRIGRLMLVPKIAFERMLEIPSAGKAS